MALKKILPAVLCVFVIMLFDASTAIKVSVHSSKLEKHAGKTLAPLRSSTRFKAEQKKMLGIFGSSEPKKTLGQTCQKQTVGSACGKGLTCAPTKHGQSTAGGDAKCADKTAWATHEEMGKTGGVGSLACAAAIRVNQEVCSYDETHCCCKTGSVKGDGEGADGAGAFCEACPGSGFSNNVQINDYVMDSWKCEVKGSSTIIKYNLNKKGCVYKAPQGSDIGNHVWFTDLTLPLDPAPAPPEGGCKVPYCADFDDTSGVGKKKPPCCSAASSAEQATTIVASTDVCVLIGLTKAEGLCGGTCSGVGAVCCKK